MCFWPPSRSSMDSDPKPPPGPGSRPSPSTAADRNGGGRCSDCVGWPGRNIRSMNRRPCRPNKTRRRRESARWWPRCRRAIGRSWSSFISNNAARLSQFSFSSYGNEDVARARADSAADAAVAAIRDSINSAVSKKRNDIRNEIAIWQAYRDSAQASLIDATQKRHQLNDLFNQNPIFADASAETARDRGKVGG